MTRPRTLIRLLVVSLCAAALFAAPAVAGDAILKVIPKNAIAFVVVNNIENADQICTELGEAVQAPIPTLSDTLKKKTGIDTALNKKGDMALVFYQGEGVPQGAAPVCVLLPVKDYKKFLSKFEDAEKVTDAIQKVTMNNIDVLVAQKGGYAVFAHSSGQEVLEAFLAAKGNVAGEVKPWKPWMNRQAAYVVLTNYGLQKYLKEGIEMLEGTIESFENFPSTSPQLEQIKKSLRMYVMAMKAIRANAKQFGLGMAKVDKGAIQVSLRCDAKPGSDLAKMTEDSAKLPVNPMSVLPDGSFVLAGGAPLSQKAMAVLIQFSQTMNGSQLGLSKEQNDKLTKLSLEAIKPVLGQSFMFGAPSAKAGTALDNACGVMWVTNADAYLTAYKKQIEAMNEYLKDEEEAPMQMSVEETKVEGHKALVGKVDFSGFLSNPQLAQAGDILKSFFGEDLKMTVYNVKVSDNMIVTAMGGKDQLSKLIKTATTKAGSLAANEGIKKVNALLPADAQGFGYWSPAGTVEFANWIIAKLPAELTENMPFEKLPEFPTSSPVGMAFRTGSGSLEGTLTLPSDTLSAIAKYIKELQTMGPH